MVKRFFSSVLCLIVLTVSVVGFANAGCQLGQRFVTHEALPGTIVSDSVALGLTGGIIGIALGLIAGFWFCGRICKFTPIDSASRIAESH